MARLCSPHSLQCATPQLCPCSHFPKAPLRIGSATGTRCCRRRAGVVFAGREGGGQEEGSSGGGDIDQLARMLSQQAQSLRESMSKNGRDTMLLFCSL